MADFIAVVFSGEEVFDPYAGLSSRRRGSEARVLVGARE
jgi:hypothetical protein